MGSEWNEREERLRREKKDPCTLDQDFQFHSSSRVISDASGPLSDARQSYPPVGYPSADLFF